MLNSISENLPSALQYANFTLQIYIITSPSADRRKVLKLATLIRDVPGYNETQTPLTTLPPSLFIRRITSSTALYKVWHLAETV